MQRRFAAGEVDDVELVVILGEMREDLREILHRHPVSRVIFVDRVADRTIEIARRGDRDDWQVHLLLV
jgi:hypothetical protein